MGQSELTELTAITPIDGRYRINGKGKSEKYN